MKTIPLSQGQYALVDDADYPVLAKYRWSAMRRRNCFYAIRHGPRPERECFLMHRAILGVDTGIQGDHEDGNGLNNQRYNLRHATGSQNGQGFRTPRRNKTSSFRGVCWARREGRWRAIIRLNGKGSHLGYFESEVSAARAYDVAAKELFKEFAQLNFTE